MEVNRRVICNNLIFFKVPMGHVHMPTFLFALEQCATRQPKDSELFLALKQ